MATERIRRQIERFLDEAEEAASKSDWEVVRDRAKNALALDRENPDALTYLSAAEYRLTEGGLSVAGLDSSRPLPETPPSAATPTSFANGRYAVKRFLGEGGKKKVYLAHDTLLDRDVGFALIKTEVLVPRFRESVVAPPTRL